jgi:transcriptional regulator with XRE-family HTH domain
MTARQLRAIRKRLGWTQREFAEKLGIHPNTLARQERDQAGIGGSVERLARVLDEMHRPLPKRRKS